MITITVDGVDSIITAITDYKSDLDAKLEQVLEKLANLAAIGARARYDLAQYAGNLDVMVEAHRVSATEWEVTADGESVLFIEFGTGVAYPEAPESTFAAGIVPHGQYGHGRGANPKGWYYYGNPGNLGHTPHDPKMAARGLVWTNGNPPTRAMYEASKDMQRQIEQTVREVFQR